MTTEHAQNAEFLHEVLIQCNVVSTLTTKYLLLQLCILGFELRVLGFQLYDSSY